MGDSHLLPGAGDGEVAGLGIQGAGEPVPVNGAIEIEALHRTASSSGLVAFADQDMRLPASSSSSICRLSSPSTFTPLSSLMCQTPKRCWPGSS